MFNRQQNDPGFTFVPVVLGEFPDFPLKFAFGTHSLLNIAEPLLMPEPESELLSKTLPNSKPSAWNQQTLTSVLHFTGGHPRLTQFCLQQGEISPRACEDRLRASPLPGQLYSQFQDPAQRAAVCQRLQQVDLGPFDLWPNDGLTRQLFWHNLLREQGGRLCWRADFVRRIGRELLGCG